MLSHTVLASSSSYGQSGQLPSEENFRKIINDCKHALHDPEEMKPLSAASGTQHEHMEFNRFFVRMGAAQIPGQDPLGWERAGRFVAMLEKLPRKYPSRIPPGQLREVQNVLPRVEEVLGARVSDLVRAFGDVLFWQQVVHQLSLKALGDHGATSPPFSTETKKEFAARQARLMFAFLDAEPRLDRYLVFTVSQMLAPYDAKMPGYFALARPRTEAFMRLAARSADELRAMRSRQEFTVGHVGKRLSPLERFPVVLLDDPEGSESRYIVPNYRHFAKSFNGLIDFTLHEALGSDYEGARGALFHLYLRQLIEDRLPQVVIIPETRYDQAKGGKDSPDLTLIDPNARRIILVEVKGRRINLATRLLMGDVELADNLGDAFQALRKLPVKVLDLRAGHPEFEQWSTVLATCADSPPVLVVVIREGLHLLSGLLREQVRLDPQHPLHGLDSPWCLLSADAFERAVEVAHRTGRPLAELLEEHYDRSGSLAPEAPEPDSFGEGLLPAPGSFAASFLREPEWAKG